MQDAKDMKSIVQQLIAREIIEEVMEPEYEQRPSGESEGSFSVFSNRIRLTEDQLIAKASKAIRLCAAASAEIEAAFQDT